MRTLLRLDTSIFSGQGVSTQLSDKLLNQLKAANPALRVIHRNFAEQQIPHLDGRGYNLCESQRRPVAKSSIKWQIFLTS